MRYSPLGGGLLEPGDNIDIWVIEKQLGSGGMGSVYRCHNRNAPRIKAAVKVLEGAIRHNKDAEARFIREAEILFQLDHPNIVKVRNVRTDHEPPYLEMEFVEGRALEDWLQEGKVPYDKAIQWMEQSAGAVAYLHAKGIRHRDIKPANMLVDKTGTLKVVDFGLAMESDNTRITQTGMTFGTVSYAPPEWVSPETLDPATWDIYALGVVFYEMLSGRMAFPASGQGSARQQAMQVIVGKQNHAPLDPGEEHPEAVRSLVMSACHSDPAKRPANARELFERCRAITGSGATLAPAVDLHTLIPPEPISQPTLTSIDAWSHDTESVSVAIAKRGLPVVAVAMLAFGLAIVGGIAAGFILLTLWGSSTRDVEVLALGVPDEETVKTRIGDITGKGDGVTTLFDNVPTGEVEVAWVVGSDCPIASCPGEGCPAWCDTGTRTVQITEGDDRQSVKLKLDAPQPKSVVFATHDGVVGTLDNQPATAKDGKLVFQAKPGRYRLVAEDGTCTPANEGCWERKSCPEGCRSTTRDVVVPARGDFETVALGLPEEVAPPTPAPVEPSPNSPEPVTEPEPAPSPDPRPAPVPDPEPVSASAGSPVTVAQFARFLKAKPEYQPGGAKAARGGQFYLANWSGSTPPKGAAGPVMGVSPEAAQTYCRWRGKSLPAKSDKPLPGTQMEFRLDGTAYVGADSGGSYKANGSVGNAFAIFRCK